MRLSPPTADGELVAGVRCGDERSFEQLVDRYRGPLIAYVCSRVGDVGLSEDIAQEIFISALRGIRATERPIVFKPWIYAIARNACIDEHRWQGRHVEQALTEDLGAVSPSTDPQAAVEVRQEWAALRAALAKLPRLEQELLGLRELVGLSYAEIAACTGLTTPAVESALHRARRHRLARYRVLSGERPARPIVVGASRVAAGVP